MKTMGLRRTPSGSLLAALALAGLVLLPSCDPATLTPEQREILTGTTDVGTITLTVTPTVATVMDTSEFAYHVSSVGFTGTITLALSLPPDVELARDLTHNTAVTVTGNRDLDGTFVLRARADRADPVEVLLNMTSVGTAGSRVEHPPARIRLTLRRPGPLDLDCSRDPRTGAAPLTVRFEARVSGCAGSCPFYWEFGDGGRAEERRTEHTYVFPGVYPAAGVLTDASGARIATCEREVVVQSPAPGPAPGPVPTAPGAPTASFTFRVTCCPPTLHVDASASTGSITSYTWDLSWTPASPDAVTTSPTTSFLFNEGDRGSVTLTVRTANGQTATVTRAYP
jgi:PKD repeat protein